MENVYCGLWEGPRQITSIFNQESYFKLKAAVSTDIRTGNFPYPLCEVEGVRCFIGGGEICSVFGFGMFSTVSCHVLLSGVLGFFSPQGVLILPFSASRFCVAYTVFLISSYSPTR